MEEPIHKQTERVHQKRRTRAAVLDAAVALVKQGKSPSVPEAADAARVSRATAYRYFPTQEHLLTEVFLEEAIAQDINQALTQIQQVADPERRLDLLLQAVCKFIITNEASFRTMLRLSLEPQSDLSPESELQIGRLRGGRRIGWIEAALAPIRMHLNSHHFRYLVMALAHCTGIEALIVLRDVCHLDPLEAEMVMRWEARTLLRASLAEVSSGQYNSSTIGE